jgi:hypothetical protein
MAGYFVFRHADIEVDCYFVVADNICRLLFRQVLLKQSILTTNHILPTKLIRDSFA